MPASRWHMGWEDIMHWLEEDAAWQEAIMPFLHRILNRTKGEDQDNASETPQGPEPQAPEILEIPILPLRGTVVYPQTGTPLTVGLPRSIRLVDDVLANDRRLGLVASKKPELEDPAPEDLYDIGTIASIHRLFRAPDGTVRLLVQGQQRMRVLEYIQTEPYFVARVEVIPEATEHSLETEALARNVREQFQAIAEMVASIPKELVASVLALEDPLQLVYTIANFQRMSLEDAQEILALDSVTEKLHKLLAILTHEAEVLELGQKIQDKARSEIEKMQREYFLREQMKAIQSELGEDDEQSAEIKTLRRKIEAAGMPEEAKEQALHELERLARLPIAAAEYGVIRTYLDWLTSLPWSEITADDLDLARAQEVLDKDHYGLEEVKERILEYLAVRKMRQERREALEARAPEDAIRHDREGAILCFVGPPGVGKTSLGRSIARAMGRKFVRISLGGVRDEAEIRGHRRTYIGAMPGRIIQALRRVGTRNPVFMLDEIDKLVFDFHGDPASALLEVLDPEQNTEFRDHYLEVAFDLSQVLFITTANDLDNIPAPLRDRMEIIPVSGYTENEKVEIAKGYLVPRQIHENGLFPEEITFTDEALHTIARAYTREAGVRNLERQIGKVCRKVARQIAEGKTTHAQITADNLSDYLGRPRYYGLEEVAHRVAIPGVAIGLAWTPAGGDILFVEATKMPGSKGFTLTGSLGEVMQESAQAALSYVRSRAAQWGIPEDFFEKTDIHLHVPAGAQPKDGPSAGITMATALVSLLTEQPVKPEIGMTGEITLRGQVLPVGGIKEKILAAHRAGLTTIILPQRNQADLEDLPEQVRETMRFIFVTTADEVIQAALAAPSQHPDDENAQGAKRHA